MVVRFPRPGRRTAWGSAVAVGILAIGCLSFGPVVRARVSREAARRHVHVDVGSVRPTWFGFRLLRVAIRLDEVDDVRANLDEVRVVLSGAFGVRRVQVHGGSVRAIGTDEKLTEEIGRWRALAPGTKGAPGPVTPIHLDGLALQWTLTAGGERSEEHTSELQSR